jgi:predicted TIM-barrel fold metal-dependent hydrolase
MSDLIIDFHTHVFPDPLSEISRKLPVTYAPDLQSIQDTRSKLRSWIRPAARYLQNSQTLVRHLPEAARTALESIGGLITSPMLLVESTPADLAMEMREQGVSRAIVIASPPFASNAWILKTCQEHEEFFVPCVYAPESPEKLRELVAQGARLLKIHPSIDGKGQDDPGYNALLEAASELRIPVILHTGCIHVQGLYRSPSMSRVTNFRPWFERYGNVTFILAHMNFHEPQEALDLCLEFPRLYVDTSWQPTEVVAEAVRRIGSERILLGSDWPLLGANMPTAIERVRDITRFGLCNEQDVRNILGLNAQRLLSKET